MTHQDRIAPGPTARARGRASVSVQEPFEERIRAAIDHGVRDLLARQAPDGYWLGELGADTTLESDYTLYLHILGRPDRIPKLANEIRARQLPDGGWNIYEGGPAELNATVKAYVALRLAGDAPHADALIRARARIHALGGLERTNSFVRFYLALAGAIGWNLVPAMPPELMLLPAWFPVNLYAMSSWTRAILVPLTILYAQRPAWRLPESVSVDELFLDPAQQGFALAWRSGTLSWRNTFLALDRAAKLYERLPWKPLRRRALARARTWLFDHLERSDGLAAIYPAMMNSIFALMALGHAPDSPVTAAEIAHLARLEIEDGDTIRLQPCLSPVWDTAIAVTALREAGLPSDHPALVRAGAWLLDRQILGAGDWQIRNPDAAPGGWAFEFRNEFYPDVDDTAIVLMALQQVDHPDIARRDAALQRGLRWMIGMQNRDGGWGAFDRDNDRALLTQIPFADHNAMIDPSTADVTARVLECLGRFGRTPDDPVVARGLAFLAREQAADGSWYGRWGVNYVYGTSGVLRALEALALGAGGEGRRGVAWLGRVQNHDGGFGETCASYDDVQVKGEGESTPSQTAWGLIGLLAAGTDPRVGDAESAGDTAAARAAHWLVERQRADGSWDEQATTGTGFPRVFYLRYQLYRQSFPLSALARYLDRRR